MEHVPFAAGAPAQTGISACFALPEGWSARQREQPGNAAAVPLGLAGIDPAYPVYDIYNQNGALVGAIGCGNYEPYEGDRDSVAVVYAALRLGAVYRFDTGQRYEVAATTRSGETALTDVIFQEGAAAPERRNIGILTYDREKTCFLAAELDANFVTEAQAREIAESLQIGDSQP